MLKRFVCNCNCSQAVDMSNDFKYSTCFVQGKTVFADGRVNFFCLNYEPPEEEKTIEQKCKKCGEVLFTNPEIEAGICQKCVMYSTDTPKPETEKKGDEKENG